jgi:serine protease
MPPILAAGDGVLSPGRDRADDLEVTSGARPTMRAAAVVSAAVIGLVLAGPSAGGLIGTTAAGADGPSDPVGTALVQPGALDSLSDVGRLADATADRRGTPIGVVTDRNGTAPGGIEVERIVAPAGDVGALTEALQDVDGVFSAAPDRRVEVSADPLEGDQYGPSRIGARSLPPGDDGRGTTVAVVDTGVTATHPDLRPRLPDGRARVAVGRSFLLGDRADGSAGDVDPHGHGTHVAGIITAARDNGIGGSGVAPGAQVLPVRVLNRVGIGWASDVAAGILWAHQQGADVINLSLAAAGNVPGNVDTAITYVTTDRSRGKPPTVVVAAAGNDGPTSGTHWPANQPRTIAVGATDATDRIAPFSSWGPAVDVAAPGDGILSTCRTGGWCTMSGTSMAAPMVSGAAAVLRQLDTRRGPDEIRARLVATAVDLGPRGVDPAFGAGRIDLAAAVSRSGPAPAAPAADVTGSVDYALTDRRRVVMGGTAFDPAGAPLVHVVVATGGRVAVHDTVATNGSWETAWDDGAGPVQACAVGVRGSGTGVLLGCRSLIVK